MRRLEPIAKFAERLGIPLKRAYWACAQGHIPSVKIGRRVFIDLDTFEAQIEAQLAEQRARAAKAQERTRRRLENLRAA